MAQAAIDEAEIGKAFEALGLSGQATEAEVRAAYLARIQLFPPDREPEKFETVRDAYDLLRDPRTRARRVLADPEAIKPLADLVKNLPSQTRRFVGPEPWLAILKERRS